MAALSALVILLAASWATAYPSTQVAVFPENVRGSSSRIVSGWEAEEGQIPHQISVRMVSTGGLVFSCGASIIHNEWALTAAHCTANRVTLVLRFGSVDLSRPSLIFETTSYYNHPLYNEAIAGVVQNYDVGLLKFNRFVEYTDFIKPIRLQSSVDKNKDYDGVVMEASGWGRTWTNGPAPEILNWVYLSGISNSHCFSLFGDLITDSTICASAYNVSSQSTCQGDSGGPLVVEDQDGDLTQVGISSFVSRAGCHIDFPAGFVRPGHFHDWYTEVTGINFDWDFSQVTTVAPEVEDNPSTTVKEEEEEEVEDISSTPASTTVEEEEEEGGEEEGGEEEGGEEEGGEEEDGEEEGGEEEGGEEEGGEEEGGEEEGGEEEGGEEEGEEEEEGGEEDGGEEEGGEEEGEEEDSEEDDSSESDEGDSSEN